MASSSCRTSSVSSPHSLTPLSLPKTKKFLSSSLSSKRPRAPIVTLTIGLQEIAGLAHNKVLVAATVSASIGQLSKPFTSAIGGHGFKLKSLVQSGGMPSTHSASVVAAATSLGLERGFSDSIFGMSAVFAALVMYDAQGVRREVGRHAKILNRILKAEENEKALCLEEDTFNDSKPETSSASSYTSSLEPYSVRGSGTASSDSDSISRLKISFKELNESVGHTEIQVLGGALLGFVVSVAINTLP